MKRVLILLIICLFCILAKAESIALFSDNGQGGIHKSNGKTLIIDGQYYVDLSIPLSKGKVKNERQKVYRVKDNARLFYHQAKWAEKYTYVIESNNGTPYYFNMKSVWKPSLTDDPNDPTRTVPQKKLTVMRKDIDGSAVPMKVLLVRSNGKLMLYAGDDFFGYTIESNATPDDYAPKWSRKYKYRASIGGWPVYFNISDN